MITCTGNNLWNLPIKIKQGCKLKCMSTTNYKVDNFSLFLTFCFLHDPVFVFLLIPLLSISRCGVEEGQPTLLLSASCQIYSLKSHKPIVRAYAFTLKESPTKCTSFGHLSISFIDQFYTKTSVPLHLAV